MDKSNFTDAVKRMATRRSVRSFSDAPIEDDVLNGVLEAGINAASGGNLQPYSILVERDKERSAGLSRILHYSFIANAPVNLLFIMDWHKLAVYSRCRQAPFIENYSTNHFMVAWDDTTLAAQAVESAAWLYGIGSCFIGHVTDCVDELREMYNLPDMSYPVLLLAMGYPKVMPAKPKKLSKDLMVFESRYPNMSDEEICRAFDEKYSGKKLPMPTNQEALNERMDKFHRALALSYNQEESERIIKEALDKGYLSEIQRLFGIHYHPEREIGASLMGRLNSQKLYPFIEGAEIEKLK